MTSISIISLGVGSEVTLRDDNGGFKQDRIDIVTHEAALGAGRIAFETTKHGRPMGPDMDSSSNQQSYNVLVMDDEPLVLSSVSLLLTSMGHSVVQAEDGDEALSAADAGSFDAAILDLMVQNGRGGADIAAEFRRKCPNCRLILSSGLSTEVIDPGTEAGVFDDRLPKPFSLQDLRNLFCRLFPDD